MKIIPNLIMIFLIICLLFILSAQLKSCQQSRCEFNQFYCD